MNVLLVAIALLLLTAFLAAACARVPRAATFVGAGGAVTGCLLGLAPTLGVLFSGDPIMLRLTWDASAGAFSVGIDALSAFFLLPVLGLSALAAVYGGDFMYACRGKKSLGGAWFFFNVFVTGMILVIVARTAFLFLFAWEAMSLAAFFLVTFEDEKAEVRRAGWIYLVATHLGAAFLFLTFLLIARHAGSLEFAGFHTGPAMSAGSAGLIFLLALIGFGAKAGFVPFHVWLPEAYPAAPAHVSAVMSGAMSKLGFYGIMRVLTFLGPLAPWWGLTLAGLGLLTALVGISLSLHQRDMKRVVAYSSVENMGLIGLALGVGLWAQAVNHLPVVAALALTAGLLHIWNHALIKALMFLAVGSVELGAGTRDLEKLGGLAKRMPWTAAAMMAGALAIAALPPLNAFVGKWLLYLSLMKCGLVTNGGSSLTALLSVGLLALIGGLTAVSFVRLTGIVLLGSPRSEAAKYARESSRWMLWPMQILVLLCIAMAVMPQEAMRLLRNTLENVLGQQSGSTLREFKSLAAPLREVGEINAWILLAVGSGAIVVWAWSRRAARAEEPTWGCGYAMPTVRMQYTGRSFSQMLAEHVLPRFLRPRTMRQTPQGLFPTTSDFEAASPDPVAEKVYEPFFRRWADRCSRLRILQQGNIHVYLIYIAVTVVLALAWTPLRTWWGSP